MMLPPTTTTTTLLLSRAGARAVTRPLSRPFSTTLPVRSVLFNLGGLATSRESQYLSKEHGIPRTEYSSNIHLIRSSEVDPFAAPGASKPANLEPRPQPDGHPEAEELLLKPHQAAAVQQDAAIHEAIDTLEAVENAALQAEKIEGLTRQLQGARERLAELSKMVENPPHGPSSVSLAAVMMLSVVSTAGLMLVLWKWKYLDGVSDRASTEAAASVQQRSASEVDEMVPAAPEEPSIKERRHASLSSLLWAPGHPGWR